LGLGFAGRFAFGLGFAFGFALARGRAFFFMSVNFLFGEVAGIINLKIPAHHV